jgi:hypothetical protein
MKEVRESSCNIVEPYLEETETSKCLFKNTASQNKKRWAGKWKVEIRCWMVRMRTSYGNIPQELGVTVEHDPKSLRRFCRPPRPVQPKDESLHTYSKEENLLSLKETGLNSQPAENTSDHLGQDLLSSNPIFFYRITIYLSIHLPTHPSTPLLFSISPHTRKNCGNIQSR